MTYVEEKSLYVAEGDVVISRRGQTLHAQRAIYHQKDGVVDAFGDVRLEAHGDILTGDRGTFNLRTSTGELTKARLFLHENHFWVRTADLKKVGPNTYIAKNCRLTSCDGDRPDWSITASEVRVTIEGYGTMKDAAFRIRDVPVLWTPYGKFAAKTKRSSGILLPSEGHSSLNGLDVELPIYWVISDQMDATFYERAIEKRGFMQGLEFRYVGEQNSKGTFLLDALSDKIKTKNMQDPDELNLSPFPRTNQTRYWARGRMDQQLPMDIQARFDADYVSDQDYLKEFTSGSAGVNARPDLQETFGRPVDDIRSPTRRSALRLSRDGEDYSLQALGAYYQNPVNPAINTTPQSLGGLNFSLLPRSIAGSSTFVRFDTNYDYITSKSGPTGHRFSLNPEITYPMFFGNFLQFQPTIGYSQTMEWLERDPLGINYESRRAYTMQTRLSTVLSRVFPIAWRGVTALRHKVIPSIIYAYRVPQDQGEYQPWFDPIDAEGKVNMVAFSLENILDSRSETKKSGVRYRQWGTFTLVQPYNIDAARGGGQAFAPLLGTLNLNPSANLGLEAHAAWDYDQNSITNTGIFMSLGMDRSGGRRDTLSVAYQYTQGGVVNPALIPGIITSYQYTQGGVFNSTSTPGTMTEYQYAGKSLAYRLHVNLVRGFSVGNTMTRDLDAGRTIQNSIWIRYASQCWAVSLVQNYMAESGTSWMVYFQLFGLGGR